MKTIEERLEVLENQKPVVGPRGPAGPIEAAVANANQAVADAEARVQAKADASYVKFTAEVKALRDDFAKLTTRLNEIIQTAVENHTIKMFEEYGVVSDFDGKRITTK